MDGSRAVGRRRCDGLRDGVAVTGIENLRRACEELSSDDGNRRHRLKAAVAEFELALAHGYRTWPARLRREADGVRDILFRHGVPELAVNRMSEADVREAVEALQRLCGEFGPVAECV